MTRLIMPVVVSALLMSAARGYAQDATVTPKDIMVYGMKIHYLEAGRGAPVILLHGSGGEGARWMPTIRGLASTRRVFALDPSGAGERNLGMTTEEEVRALRVPTLLLWGKDDVLSGPANADRLNAAISGSRKIFIEKAGHYPFIEQPAQFNKAVLEFLAAAASTE